MCRLVRHRQMNALFIVKKKKQNTLEWQESYWWGRTHSTRHCATLGSTTLVILTTPLRGGALWNIFFYTVHFTLSKIRVRELIWLDDGHKLPVRARIQTEICLVSKLVSIAPCCAYPPGPLLLSPESLSAAAFSWLWIMLSNNQRQGKRELIYSALFRRAQRT